MLYKLNENEIEILIDALNMALASNERMQKARPKFKAIFDKIETDITALKVKLQSPPTNK